MDITKEDWIGISQDLEIHHAIFYQCWLMGRPIFTDSIETAAVRFNKQGEFLEFLFNPKFWEEKTPYERLFVIAHECLHVILNHGKRIGGQVTEAKNVTLDIVVNHALVNNFGFDRLKIKNSNELCWVDTVFKDKPGLPTNESFEFYYNLLPKIPAGLHTVDLHDTLPDSDEVIDKNSLRGLVEKNNAQASTGSGGWTFVDVTAVKPKKKWETIIKKWAFKELK